MSAPNAGKVFYNHSRVRFLSRCPKQLNRTFERIIFLRLPVRNRTLTDSSFLQGIRHILCSDMTTTFFSHTHTHTHTQGPRSRIHTHTHTQFSHSFTHLLFLLQTERLSHFSFFLKSSRTNFKHPTWVRLPKSPPSHRPLPDQIQLWRRVCPHQKEPRREMLQGTHLRPLPGIRTWRSVQTRTRLESRTLIMRTQTFSSDSWTTSHERAHHRHQNQVPSWTQQPLSWWTGMWNS